MKVKAEERGIVDIPTSYNKQDKDIHWYDGLDFKNIVDLLPVIRGKENNSDRVQMSIHKSTVVVATQIREKNPGKFKINLDVYRSMLYAGRQLFDLVYLKHGDKKSKSYHMAKIIEDLEDTVYTQVFVDELLKKLLEGYLSQGQGQFSRDRILEKIEEIKPLLTQELIDRCDNFIDDELDSVEVRARIKERLRKREYRKNNKKNNVVSIY